MDKLHSYENMLNQSLMINLHLSLKSLDLLGHSVAAAHIDAAIQSLKNATKMDLDTTAFDASLDQKRAKMDVSARKYTLTTLCNEEDRNEANFLETGAEI